MSENQKNSVTGLGIITVICLIIFTHPNNSKSLFKSSFSIPFFPVQKTPADASMQALLSGPLKLEEKCLKVGENLIVWPYGFSMQTKEAKVNILNKKGIIVASVGDTIKLSGGQVTAQDSGSEKMLSQFVNDDCKGPLWITGEVLAK